MTNLFGKVMKGLGFSKLIKIPGKTSFDQLTKPEVGLMIEAFLQEGNEYFDPLAFNDFLHASLLNEQLKQLQEELNRCAFLPSGGDDWPRVDYDYLKRLVEDLRK